MSDIILPSSFLVKVIPTEPELRSMKPGGRKRLGGEVEQLCPGLEGLKKKI